MLSDERLLVLGLSTLMGCFPVHELVGRFENAPIGPDAGSFLVRRKAPNQGEAVLSSPLKC